MGIYREKKEQLIEKIKFYKKRIADDTAKWYGFRQTGGAEVAVRCTVGKD